ncbi:hypothetical protein [Muribaculum intestinale]|uniref:hypothetical protein n=1 Tax=Muribaculum intestinale TaxID=1796646 RepID=UPI0025A9575D|nr:hypothetical protein [Muribaculum intestinale]
MSDQKRASIPRTIMFRSKGANYTAFLHASTGDLIQQYDDVNKGPYHPEITASSPITLQFTATSSAATGAVTPDSIDYKIGDTALAFDSSGECTTAGAQTYFKKVGGNLVIIGNIARYLGGQSSIITAIAKKGGDTLNAFCPVSVSKYVDGTSAKVSIAAADSNNFTITDAVPSVRLKAGVLSESGWVYNQAKYYYKWEKADAAETSGWKPLKAGSGTNGTITIDEGDVDTYANIKVSVYEDAAMTKLIGTDTVGVIDASDPLDIIVSAQINETGGTGASATVATTNLELNDEMPDTAYLLLTPTLVKRGTAVSAGATTWLTGILTDPAGVTTLNIPPVSGQYKVTVANLKNSLGEHTLVMTGELT